VAVVECAAALCRERGGAGGRYVITLRDRGKRGRLSCVLSTVPSLHASHANVPQTFYWTRDPSSQISLVPVLSSPHLSHPPKRTCTASSFPTITARPRPRARNSTTSTCGDTAGSRAADLLRLDAHPAADERRRERGVDLGQDAPRVRRPPLLSTRALAI
jgi:hypothetical protein